MSDTSSKPSMAVCIITHKHSTGLHRLLVALKPQIEKHSNRSVAVVNDGSHDEAYESVRQEFDGLIDYQALSKNIGVAEARNRVAHLAQGDYLVFIDDDCLPPPFWLDWLAATLETYPEMDVIAGSTTPLLTEKPSFFARVQATHGIHPNPARHGNQIRFVTANLAIRQTYFWKLGGFHIRPGFPGTGEDTELSSRVSRSSGARHIDYDWYVYHEVGDGLRSNLSRYWRYGFSDGWLLHFTISPPYHDYIWQYVAKRKRFTNFFSHLKKRIAEAQPHHTSIFNIYRSALLATMILDIAYTHGMRTARYQHTSGLEKSQGSQ